jgi:hypothetical protein
VSYTGGMNSPLPNNTTITTRWVTVDRLLEMRAGTSSPLDNPVWVADRDPYTDSDGVRTATSHLLSNITGYDEGQYFLIQFPDGTPDRRVSPNEVIEVYGISPGRDLLEGVNPLPDPPRTRGAR